MSTPITDTDGEALGCTRYITKTALTPSGANDTVEVLCPEVATDDVTVSIDRRRYSVLMCAKHKGEHVERMAARRRRGTPAARVENRP